MKAGEGIAAGKPRRNTRPANPTLAQQELIDWANRQQLEHKSWLILTGGAQPHFTPFRDFEALIRCLFCDRPIHWCLEPYDFCELCLEYLNTELPNDL